MSPERSVLSVCCVDIRAFALDRVINKTLKLLSAAGLHDVSLEKFFGILGDQDLISLWMNSDQFIFCNWRPGVY